MDISPSDRAVVYFALPGGRRSIVMKTGFPSYCIPAVLRWLKRRGLASNVKRGFWEPKKIPQGVGICWEHGILTLDDFCPACPARDHV